MVKLAGVDAFGLLNEKQLSDIAKDLKIYMRLMHGPDLSLEPGDPDLQLIESIAPEIRLIWAGFGDAYKQAFMSTAIGAGLDKAVEVLRLTRKQATAATGEVTFSRVDAAPPGGIPIAAGTIVETDEGVQFSTDEAATIPAGDMSISAPVTAIIAGEAGNVASSTITVLVSNVAGVDSVSNAVQTSGGADREGDEALRARALNAAAVRGTATTNAIRSALLNIPSVRAAQVVNNDEDDTNADDTFFISAQTGTASETISSGGNTKLAQKFTVPAGGRWIQDLTFKSTDVSNPTVTVRIEGDSGGSPDGILAHGYLEKTGIDPNNGTTTSVHFTRAGFLEAGTYWRVIVVTAGSLTVDGGTGGTADQVKFFNGSVWALSASIENSFGNIIAGVPAHSFECYVLGGTVQEVIDAIGGTLTTGARAWGKDHTGTFVDNGLNEYEMSYSDAIEKPIYLDLTITTTDDWDATEGPDAVRDAIIAYIGGTDTNGQTMPGLDLGEEVLRAEIIAAIMGVTGVRNITTLKIDTVDPPSSTTGDIDVDATEIARAEAAAGIDVTVA